MSKGYQKKRSEEPREDSGNQNLKDNLITEGSKDDLLTEDPQENSLTENIKEGPSL